MLPDWRLVKQKYLQNKHSLFQPGEFIHTLGDSHVYLNHVEPLQEQLKRTPRPFPTLKIKRNVSSIDEFVFDDFELTAYNPHPKLNMQMAV